MTHFTYINGSQVVFRKDVMVVAFVSTVKQSALNPLSRPAGKYGYELSYSPAEGKRINGLAISEITWTPELTAFVKTLTNGARFENEYSTAFAQAKRTNVALHREHRANHTDTDTDEVMRERY